MESRNKRALARADESLEFGCKYSVKFLAIRFVFLSFLVGSMIMDHVVNECNNNNLERK